MERKEVFGFQMEMAEAMIRVMHELTIGICSAEEEGWISEDDFRSHFINRWNMKKPDRTADKFREQ